MHALIEPMASYQITITTSEGLEVLAAVVVTAGPVAGYLVLFSPLRVDNRVPPAPASQTAERP